MLLDEETSQHIEKDPLDPLNDDYFPEKMYVFILGCSSNYF